jgi:competence protein ComEC
MTFADFPFLRYLFFFFGGIVLAALLPDTPPQLPLGLMVVIWLSYLGQLIWSPTPNTFFTSSLAYLLLIGLGCYVSLISRQEALAGDIPWEEGKGYLAEVQRYDVPKANSSENLLSVVAIQGTQGWQPQKALVLVYHQLDEELYPGQMIWVPSNPERLAPPSFPNEFNYKRFLAAKGIHFRQFLGKKLVLLPLKQSNDLYRIIYGGIAYLSRIIANKDFFQPNR